MDDPFKNVAAIIVDQYYRTGRYVSAKYCRLGSANPAVRKATNLCLTIGADPEVWVESIFVEYKDPYPNILGSRRVIRIYEDYIRDQDYAKNFCIQLKYWDASLSASNGDLRKSLTDTPLDLSTWFVYIVSKKHGLHDIADLMEDRAKEFFIAFPTYRRFLDVPEREAIIDDLFIARFGYDRHSGRPSDTE